MCEVVDVPVTVKMRIGTLRAGGRDLEAAVQQFDEADYDRLCDFLVAVRAAGADSVIVHARKAVLGCNWSPADNREIPPLRYDVARRLKEDFPDMPVVLNGGLRTAEDCLSSLAWADGVMLGREAYHRPMVLAELYAALAEADAAETAMDLAAPAPPRPRPLTVPEHLERMAEYAEHELARGERLPAITRHMLGLLSHVPGAREYRRLLSEGARAPGAGPELLRQAARLCEGGDGAPSPVR
jgi:tRNA-dihydrouridine synthase A